MQQKYQNLLPVPDSGLVSVKSHSFHFHFKSFCSIFLPNDAKSMCVHSRVVFLIIEDLMM